LSDRRAKIGLKLSGKRTVGGARRKAAGNRVEGAEILAGWRSGVPA